MSYHDLRRTITREILRLLLDPDLFGISPLEVLILSEMAWTARSTLGDAQSAIAFCVALCCWAALGALGMLARLDRQVHRGRTMSGDEVP